MQSESVLHDLNKSLTSESDGELFKDFCDRMNTYLETMNWIKKPLQLSPSICSRYGWKCIKKNLLECVTCGVKLSIPDIKMRNFELYKSFLEKNLSSLKEQHSKHCPWPIAPSPESFVKMFLMPKEEALSDFVNRIQLSLPYKIYSPLIKDSVLTRLEFSESQILSLCRMAGMNDEDTSLFGKSIVPLAATGWTMIKTNTQRPYFKCNHCSRSTWSKWFKSISPENSESTECESSDSEDRNNPSVDEKENFFQFGPNSAVVQSPAISVSASENVFSKNSDNDKETFLDSPARKENGKVGEDTKNNSPVVESPATSVSVSENVVSKSSDNDREISEKSPTKEENAKGCNDTKNESLDVESSAASVSFSENAVSKNGNKDKEMSLDSSAKIEETMVCEDIKKDSSVVETPATSISVSENVVSKNGSNDEEMSKESSTEGENSSKDTKNDSSSVASPATSVSFSESVVSKKRDNDSRMSEGHPAKRLKVGSKEANREPFDPLYEHRPWCLWIQDGLEFYPCESKDWDSKKKNSAQVSNLPGWKIFIKSLLKNVSDNETMDINESPSKEHIRSVRSMLELWTNIE